MNIFERSKSLFGKPVRVECFDGQIVSGTWTEWFDESDNAWREDDGFPTCESILIDQSNGIPMELYITDVKTIARQEDGVIVSPDEYMN